jgi:hypothetical protein
MSFRHQKNTKKKVICDQWAKPEGGIHEEEEKTQGRGKKVRCCGRGV